MKTLTEDKLTAAALTRLRKAPNPRMKKIMGSLIRHAHAFVREVALTPDEWKTGVDFLTAVGHITNDKRQEFILLSDTLGISAMVDLDAHSRDASGSTDSSLLGPFYREGAPKKPLGASISNDTAGQPIIVRGVVSDPRGRPIAGALVDVWQAAPSGMYDIQDENQPDMNLRGRFRTDAKGHYEFRSVKPKSYPVPVDGPVGVLLSAQGRHPYRPAHIHFIVSADDYQPLITALYTAGDSYIDSDAVFGAKRSLTVKYRRSREPGTKGRTPELVEFNFALVPARRQRPIRTRQLRAKPARAGRGQRRRKARRA